MRPGSLCNQRPGDEAEENQGHEDDADQPETGFHDPEGVGTTIQPAAEQVQAEPEHEQCRHEGSSLAWPLDP